MHGVDWKALKQKYSVLLPYVKTRLDLNYVIGEMISELACGHAYISTGEKPEAERIDMGKRNMDDMEAYSCEAVDECMRRIYKEI